MNHQQAFLWTSNSSQSLEQALYAYLNKLVNQTQSALIYEQILKKEHPWIQWLYPPYNAAVIDDLLEQTRFQLEPQEYRIFIFNDAQTLNDASANRLLKSIEEPHPGYYFLFCTNKPQLILPTISSRCIHHFVESNKSAQSHFHDILQPFIQAQCNQPVEFAKLIEKYKLKEIESYQLFDQLFEHWSSNLHKSIKLQDQALHQKSLLALKLIEQGYQFLPMAGSSKLFWKYLYVLFHETCK
jgi:hypothetical protein